MRFKHERFHACCEAGASEAEGLSHARLYGQHDAVSGNSGNAVPVLVVGVALAPSLDEILVGTRARSGEHDGGRHNVDALPIRSKALHAGDRAVVHEHMDGAGRHQQLRSSVLAGIRKGVAHLVPAIVLVEMMGWHTAVAAAAAAHNGIGAACVDEPLEVGAVAGECRAP